MVVFLVSDRLVHRGVCTSPPLLQWLGRFRVLIIKVEISQCRMRRIARTVNRSSEDVISSRIPLIFRLECVLNEKMC